MAQQPSGLVVDGISKFFGRNPALIGVSLTVDPGEVVGLFGRDGAGKTVCFEAIIGLTGVDSGRILLGGRDVTRLTVDRRAPLGLSYLPQETSIFRGLTTEQNIAAVLEISEPDRERREERLDSLLDDFSIEYVRDTPSTRLSGGERRRCEIARAMATAPSIMLLDEPFAGIDPLSIASIRQTIARLKQMGVGVLLSDQNVHEMVAIIDRAFVLHQGQVIFAGDPESMLADRDVNRHYLGRKFGA